MPFAGRVITVDALHMTGNTARGIVETHGADRLMTVKRNARETYKALGTINRERDATGALDEDYVKGHGRTERRRIQTMTPPPGMTDHPHVARILRVERELDGPDPEEERKPRYACGVTSVPEGRGTPRQLLEWNRGHWAIENVNHRARDVNFGEDACPSRKGHAPANNATCNDIALALILGRGSDIAGMTRRFALHRGEAIDAIPSNSDDAGAAGSGPKGVERGAGSEPSRPPTPSFHPESPPRGHS